MIKNYNHIMFHKTTAIFFVALYIIAMFQPVSPFMKYALNYDYIAEILCINKDKPELECNGKCYLIKEVEKQKEENKTPININLEEYPIGFVEILSVATKNQPTDYTKTDFLYQKNYSFLADYSVFHPPTV